MRNCQKSKYYIIKINLDLYKMSLFENLDWMPDDNYINNSFVVDSIDSAVEIIKAQIIYINERLYYITRMLLYNIGIDLLDNYYHFIKKINTLHEQIDIEINNHFSNDNEFMPINIKIYDQYNDIKNMMEINIDELNISNTSFIH